MTNITEQLADALRALLDPENGRGDGDTLAATWDAAREALARYDAEGDTDGEMWRKHKDSFKVLEAMLEAASPLVLNRLKAEEAVKDSQRE